MPRVCPRPCSRLAAAAVFISVGVVQFVVGIVLLRSKYVYLLAGPDFWTSTCNVAVGCLLGLSASIWKRSKKRESKKHALRSHLLLALLMSSLTLNATTLGILLLGEGNTLVSIRLENSGKYSNSTFASEVLAYAFVTSVCCPIICIVISIVSMSGSCFKYASMNKSIDKITPINSMKKGQPRSLKWIYSPELLELSKKKLREFVLSSSSEYSSDEECENSSYHKYADSPEAIQSVLSHMAQGKRDTILNDSAIMLRQMDLRRKKLAALNQNGSYLGPTLSHSKERRVAETKCSRDPSLEYDNSLQRSENSRRDSLDINTNNRIPPEDIAMDRAKYLNKGKHLSMLYKNPYASGELLNEYQSTASKLIKHNPSQYKKFRERLRTGSELNGPSSSCIADINDYGINNSLNTHKASIEMDRNTSRNKFKSKEHLGQVSNSECCTEKSKLVEDNKKSERFELNKHTSPDLSYCFSPEEYDALEDSTFNFSRTSSWASEVVPINVKHSSVARLSNKLIPVASPVVPSLEKKSMLKTSDDSGIGTMESNSFSEVSELCDIKNGKVNFSSFSEDSKLEMEETMQRHTKVGQSSAKRYDLNNMVKMASISEESCLELNNSENNPIHDELDCEVMNDQYNTKSLPISHSKSSQRIKQENFRADAIPKRKSTLKKMWSSAFSENDILDQVVDEDSLIGLSEEELIARQFRIRSIRKVIQQRIREKEGS